MSFQRFCRGKSELLTRQPTTCASARTLVGRNGAPWEFSGARLKNRFVQQWEVVVASISLVPAHTLETQRGEMIRSNHAWQFVRILVVTAVAAFLILERYAKPYEGISGTGPRVFELQNHDGGDKTTEASLPPLSTLLGDRGKGGGDGIIGNVQFLLDFAIIGHPGTATIAVAGWLKLQKDVEMKDSEEHSLTQGRPASLVNHLYHLPMSTSNLKRGYVASGDLLNFRALASLRSHWPETKLVVGVWHPVEWFACWYSDAVTESRTIPPAEALVGKRFPDQVRYHFHLAQLGKTSPTSDSVEADLLGPLFRLDEGLGSMPNKIFLYDVAQGMDANQKRTSRFLQDLAAFVGHEGPLTGELGLKTNLPERQDLAIDICEERYAALRTELIENGRVAASWILEYFLKHSDVSISSANYFTRVLKSWSTDPCDPAIPPLSSVVVATDGRPPLDSLVDAHGDITGDVQFLLNFAIVGHPQTMTTSMMNWLHGHEEIQIPDHEVHALKNHRPAELVRVLYKDLAVGRKFKRGYKAPNDLRRPFVMEYYRRFWPDTKLIVGVRHPIKWIQSHLNFKIMKGQKLLSPENLVDDWKRFERVEFHKHLALLGKTPMTSDAELKLLGAKDIKSFTAMRNKVFLYDISQPDDINETRKVKFRNDLSLFLELAAPLATDPPEDDRDVPDDFDPIDICDVKFSELRAVLLGIGVAASEWIASYFMDHADVSVSSPEHFRDALQAWKIDPCEATKQPTEGAQSETVLAANKHPPLWSVLNEQGDEITGKIEAILDFAIIGNPGCGTTTLSQWLAAQSEIQIQASREVHSLRAGKAAELVRILHRLPIEDNQLVGYLGSNDIRSHVALSSIARYWPRAKLIVGLQHPIKFFEAWYNANATMPANAMVGEFLPKQVMFHKHLALLGKTNTSTKGEAAELAIDSSAVKRLPFDMPNPVFLFDASQLTDRDQTRYRLFRRDLSQFLGIAKIKPIDSIAATEMTPGIDLCRPLFDQLRKELLEVGAKAAKWIRNDFLDREDVVVSSRKHFESLLSTWHVDPCEKRKAGKTDATGAVSHAVETATTTSRPPLSSLIGDLERNITADVQFLLDFAIVGFPKTGTSSLMRWMSEHEEIEIYTTELRSLKNDKPAELVKYMYDLPAGSQYKRGYKSPHNICSHPAVAALKQYWPETNLVMGIRHPVKWFDSWYNFKMRQGYSLPPPEKMVDEAFPTQISYHRWLSVLYKTNHRDDPRQMELLEPLFLDQRTATYMPNKIFLFDVAQPFDKNASRNDQFRRDYSKFLGLRRELDPLPVRQSSHNLHYAIDICDEKYDELRSQLMDVGIRSSKWISEFFMNSKDVTVSSPDYFREILATWLEDPCGEHQRLRDRV